MSKITKEELKELQEQQGKLNAIKHDIGLLSTQIHSLNHMYADEISKQEEAKKKLVENYGNVNIDLKDGSYTEIEEETK
jgi:hypothetical protein